MRDLLNQVAEFIEEKHLCIVSINRANEQGFVSTANVGERRLDWLNRAIDNIFSQLDEGVK